VAYFITTIGAFGVVSVLSGENGDADRLEDYSGLFWRRPVLGSIFTVMLLSLAGIPVTAGFLAKFYVVAAGASTANWALVLILVITSVIGLFYYLRIVVTMYAPVPEEIQVPTSLHPGSYVLIALTVLLLWFGIYPGLLLNIIKTALTM
jgi:NADH-quinone oxidoreductase subunit N